MALIKAPASGLDSTWFRDKEMTGKLALLMEVIPGTAKVSNRPNTYGNYDDMIDAYLTVFETARDLENDELMRQRVTVSRANMFKTLKALLDEAGDDPNPTSVYIVKAVQTKSGVITYVLDPAPDEVFERVAQWVEKRDAADDIPDF